MNNQEDLLKAKQQIKELEKEILLLKDPEKSLKFCIEQFTNNQPFDFEAHQEIILKGYIQTDLDFAVFCTDENSNVEKLEEEIINYKYEDAIIKFAKYVKNANRTKLTDAILNYDSISIYDFATEVKLDFFNMEKIIKRLIELKDFRNAKRLLSTLKITDTYLNLVERYEQLLIFI